MIAHIALGIAIGAYVFNNYIRWHTNHVIKSIVLWMIVGIRFLFGKTKGWKSLLQPLREKYKPMIQPKAKPDYQCNVKRANNSYPCSCGGILEPISAKGYEGHYACARCETVKKLSEISQ